MHSNKDITSVLNTPRLLLKELNPEVLHELYTNYDDEYIISFLGLSDATELASERNKWELGMTTFRISYKWFLMIEKATGKVIGRSGYHNWYAIHSRAELGYAMNNDEVKNKGFMKEALTAIIAYGFGKMGLNRIEAYIGPGNVPSLRLVRGFDFTEEGTLRSHYCKDGELQDSVCFSLLKHEYKG